jgi:hypothetical protein
MRAGRSRPHPRNQEVLAVIIQKVWDKREREDSPMPPGCQHG